MCRAKGPDGLGGRRCPSSAPRVFSLETVTLESARRSVKQVIRKRGQEWGGNINVDISSVVLARAYELAIKSHHGVRRTSGEAYINHPLRVAYQLQQRGFNDEVVATAILHDAVEDSSLTFDDLKRHGFSKRVITGVESVTKREGELYPDAVKRAAVHPIGRLVKMFDNLDNSSPEQLSPLPEVKRYRVILKYAEARKVLKESLANHPHSELFSDENGFSKTYHIVGSVINIKDFAI